MNTIYENFRTTLATNLFDTFQDTSLLQEILRIVDVSMCDFEINEKKKDIIPAADMTPLINYYLASKAVANLSKNTLRQYRYKLIHFFDAVRKPWTNIETNDIRIYLYNYKVERNAADSYIDNIRITLNSFFQWLVKDERIKKNPCEKVDKVKYQPKQREPLTPYELEKIRFSTINVREKALIDFLFSTGCRISECADVRLSDINWEKHSILIRHGKGDKERIVYFNTEAEVTMREYIKTHSGDVDALFVSTKKPYQQLKSHALENIVNAIGKRAGIPIYPHKIRHTFATMGLHNGMPLEKLQVLMGHSKTETTLIYAKQYQSDLQIEHQRAYS